MRWTYNTSSFVLIRMTALVNDSTKPDKVFQDKDVNSVAKALREYCGEIVSPTQVYNHQRNWRQKWSKVAKLKDLSGALWDSDTNVIMLEQEHFLGHCKVDTYLTKPICV
jgi:methionine salvage enolase-phosphatase E1